MKKKNTCLDELLSYSNREYDIFEQKAELLFRNKAFREDLKKLDFYFSVENRMQEIYDTPYEYALDREAKPQLPEPERADADYFRSREDLYFEINEGEFEVITDQNANYFRSRRAERIAWFEFDLTKESAPDAKWFKDKWEIDVRSLLQRPRGWDGRKETLRLHIQAGPLLCTSSFGDSGPPWTKNSILRGDGIELGVFNAVYHPKVYIAVDPWTTKVGIKEICKSLPEIKKQVFGFTTESKRYFARDLCWYDLNKELRSPAKVGRIWAEKRPDEFIALVKKTKDWKAASNEDKDAVMADYMAVGLPSTVCAAVDRLKTAVEYLTR